ncbi:MAG: serine/threonine-protein kinase [Nannocystaceae bacterium]|nr:serine/threonine-protein kinase [Nannocystaceae bacterium]
MVQASVEPGRATWAGARRSRALACPDDERLAAYVEARLDRAALRRIGEHLRGCEDCCEIVERYASAWQLPPPVAATAPSTQPGAAPRAHATGQSFARYVLLHPLGRGGMGEVHAAWDPLLARRVAIKLLPRDVGSARVLAEARALAAVNHPNIVPIFDLGSAHGCDYIAMELLDGTLAQWLAAARRSSREILDAFVQAGAGLAAAHAHGVVHRDFKPANVLVQRDAAGVLRRVCVADFGLALPRDADGRPAGTPGFVAPEQAAGAAADPRSDQYAFCVALQRALARDWGGHAPTDAANAVDPAQGRVSPRVLRALRRGTAADPRDRFASMTALLHVLTLRRSLSIALAMATITAVVGAIAVLPARAPGCASIDELRTRALPPASLARAEAAFTATGLPFAAAAWQRAEPALQQRAHAWAEQTRARCEGTTAEPGDGCLTQERAALTQALTVLGDADADVVVHVDAIVDALQPSHCAPVPADERAGPWVAALAAARITRAVSTTAARDQLEAVIAGADALDVPPLRRQAQLELARLLDGAGEPTAAIETLTTLAYDALANGDDGAALEATAQLAMIHARAPDPPKARRWLQEAQALAARTRPNLRQRAALATAEGVLLRASGDAPGALAAMQAALDAQREAEPPDVEGTAQALRNLAIVEFELQQLDAAHAHASAALQQLEAALGPWHPAVAHALDLLGAITGARQGPAAAVPLHERALAVYAATVGDDHRDAINARLHLGIELSLLDPARAIEATAAALEGLTRVLGPDHPETLKARAHLARDELALGRHDAAYHDAVAAYEGMRATLGEEHVDAAGAATVVGRALLATERPAAAQLWLRRALDHLPARPPRMRAFATEWLARAEQAGGDDRAAREHAVQAVALWAADVGPDHAETRAAQAFADSLTPRE